MRNLLRINTFRRHFLAFALTILVFLPSESAVNCNQGFVSQETVNWSLPFYKRGEELTPVIYRDNKSFLAEFERTQTVGKVQDYFHKELDTRIYFTATALPQANGRVPMIDPEAKAVFIFFHGSGTMQSGGKNFIGLMNTLASIGYSAVSLDMPFHAEGPIRDQFYSADYFMNWIHKLIVEAKKSKKPIYLVGHSFGPDVIAEYLYRHPFAVEGAALLSPAGFTPVLDHWQTTKTEKMRFGGDVPQNQVAGEWAAIVSRQFVWNKPSGLADPTIVNPRLHVRHLSGDREEYAPAPLGGKNKLPIGKNTYSIGEALRPFFRNMVSTTEPGVGHYIFNHIDASGQPIVLREILALVGESALNEKKLRIERSEHLNTTRNNADLFLFNYATDRLFQSWVKENYGSKIFSSIQRTGDVNLSRKILGEYFDVRKVREKELGLSQK